MSDGQAAYAVRVLGIAGSLRRGSFNRALLEAAVELAPEGLEIETFDIAEIQLYNADLDDDDSRPEPVRRLKDAIGRADAVLIATPEYNHGMPGVLKNAIDWASRPAGRSPFAGKPVAIMGASPGAIGSARAQQELKLALLSMFSVVMPHAGVLVGNARQKFDGAGRLSDDGTRRFLRAFLEQLRDFAAERRRPAAGVA